MSTRYKLGRNQGELDFVDIDLYGDTPLFVDPRALRLLPTQWGHECVSLIQNFFTAVLDSIREGKDQRARRLLRGLREPNEVHLGLSKKRAQGRGLGSKLARDTWRSLRESEAVKSGLLVDLEDTALMVENIDKDRVSDIAINVIREPLIRYTQDTCAYHGIPLESNVDSGPLWDPRTQDWFSRLEDLPLPAGNKLLLVPKAIVRADLDYDPGKYFRHYVLVRMQEAEIQAGTSLVELLRSGRPRVTKKALMREYGSGKRTIVEQTRRFPDVLDQYRHDKRRQIQPPLSHADIDGRIGGGQPDWKQELSAVKRLRAGRNAADDYHKAVEKLLTAVLYPQLTQPTIEFPIHQGRKRIDIVYANVAQTGFFRWAKDNYPAAHVFIECKNYKGDPANPELDQLAGRFSPSRGKVGLLVCRRLANKPLFFQRCRDTAADDRGFIIPLDDSDLVELVAARAGGGTFEFFKSRFDRLIM